MTKDDLKALADSMVAAVKQYVTRACDPLAARVSAVETRTSAIAMLRADASVGGGSDALRLLGDLDARLKTLEARPQMRYVGVWRSGEYQPGTFATDRGSLWHCWQATTDRPGTSDAWQLCAKSGRDG